MSTLEEDYSDALAPVQAQYTKSRAGEASIIAPVTTGEYRLQSQQQESTFTTEIGAMEQRLGVRIHSEITQALHHHPDLADSRRAGACMVAVCPVTKLNQKNPSATGKPAMPAPSAAQDMSGSGPASLSLHHQHQLPLPVSVATMPPGPAAGVQGCRARAAAGHGSAILPERGLLIPNLKGRGKYPNTNESWKQAIQDWLHPDPAAGLIVALKDWDPAWVRGVNGKIDSRGPKYHQRKLVAEEYMGYV